MYIKHTFFCQKSNDFISVVRDFIEPGGQTGFLLLYIPFYFNCLVFLLLDSYLYKLPRLYIAYSKGSKGGEPMSKTCQKLADIIGGQVITAAPVCVVQRLRNINATILGRRTRSPLALPFALSFENNKGATH